MMSTNSVNHVSNRAIVMAELIEEGVKESRVDNSYSRKQMGKARDAARREHSRVNLRKNTNRNR